VSKTFADLKEAAERADLEFTAQTERVVLLGVAGEELALVIRMFLDRCTCREGRCLECARGARALGAWRKARLR
jgi:hypothetical protein